MFPLRLSFLRSLRKLLFARNLSHPRSRPASPFARRVLRCEQLEDRTVPSGVVDTLASAVNFASSIDASGTSDLVTIAVADTDGNPISGLTDSDFALGLSAGTSTGAFGPVAEIGTSGTYYTLFTGNTAGTPVDLTVSVDGTSLNNQSSVQVTPGAISASTSTINLPSYTGTIDTGSVVTINVVDTAGNAITGLPSSAFQLGLSGGRIIGSFGPVTEGLSGTYATTFTSRSPGPDGAGTNTLTVTVDGIQLLSHSTVSVDRVGGLGADPPLAGIPFPRGGALPGEQSGSSTSSGTPIVYTTPTSRFASPAVASGTTDLVTIVVGKTDGSVVNGLIDKDFALSLSGGTSTGSFGPVTETATPGTYTTSFTGHTAGTPLTLTVTAGGILTTNQPTIQVTPGAVSVADSVATIAAPIVVAGATDVVAISVKDASGNAVTGLSGGAIQLGLSGGTSAGTFGPMSEIGTSGVYTVALTGTVAGTPSALSATVAEVQLTSQPTVQVTPAPPAPEPPAATGSVATATAATEPVAAAPAATAATAPEPMFSGVFMFGNLMVLEGSGFAGGFAVIPLPPGCMAFFADANGDGHGDVVLLVPHTIFVLDGLTGSALAVPF